MKLLEPDRYYDEPYGHGPHVVLLVLKDDELTEPAVRGFGRVAELARSITFWVVPIVTPEHAETVQAIRFPQYRFLQGGNEQHQHVGILEDDELLDAFDHHLEC